MLPSRTIPTDQGFVSILLGCALIGLAACSSPGEGRHDRTYASMNVPEVSLHADGVFFGGNLAVTASLTNARFSPPGGSSSVPPPPSGGMGGGHHGGGMSGGGMGGGHHRGNSAGEMESPEGEGTYRSPLGSNQPPLRLTLELENKGTTPLDVTIRDIDSDLGNFVPQPEHLVIPPGESSQLEPMISRLGVISEEIPLKLSFRSDGRIDTQTVLLSSSPATAVNPAAQAAK